MHDRFPTSSHERTINDFDYIARELRAGCAHDDQLIEHLDLADKLLTAKFMTADQALDSVDDFFKRRREANLHISQPSPEGN